MDYYSKDAKCWLLICLERNDLMATPMLITSPLFLDGWLEFNRRKWNLKPKIMEFREDNKELPLLKVTLYCDSKGRVRMPPRSPYLPVDFQPTPTELMGRLGRQWLALGNIMAGELHRSGVKGTIAFSPNITDMRPFQWQGFHVQVRYTFYLDIPVDENQIDYAVRKQIKKAAKNGFTCSDGVSPEAIIECLKETEDRQGFSHGLSAADIRMAKELLGEEHFRCYGCFAPSGEIASARIILHSPESRAVDWVAGTKREFLNSGATQAVIAFALENLSSNGAAGFDYAGANIPSVAAAKATWGGHLVPFYVLSSPSVRGMVKYGLDILRYRGLLTR